MHYAQLHIIKIVFRHLFTAIDGPTQSSKQLQQNSVYNKIGKINIEPLKQLDTNSIIQLPNSDTISTIVGCLSFCNLEQTERLRDDQVCLIVWTAKVAGLTIPSKLSPYLKYKQEEHGMARLVTTATGYLRIYGTLSDSDQLSDLQQNNLKVICQFVVAV